MCPFLHAYLLISLKFGVAKQPGVHLHHPNLGFFHKLGGPQITPKKDGAGPGPTIFAGSSRK